MKKIINTDLTLKLWQWLTVLLVVNILQDLLGLR
jgi:hypothetical protein